MSFVIYLFQQERLETAAVENKTMVATLEEAVNEQTLLKEQFLLKEVELFIAYSRYTCHKHRHLIGGHVLV